MASSAFGLVACGLIYFAAIYSFVWFGRRRIAWASRHDIVLEPEPKLPSSAADIWGRHGLDTTIIYFIFFLALAVADFPLWQRAGIAVLTAVVFGSLWISKTPGGVALDVASRSRRIASVAGYWCLAVADWLGYMGVLCFGAALIAEVL